MKHKFFIIALTMIMLMQSLTSLAAFKEYEHTKTKKIERTLKSDKSITDLSIKNSFGSVLIVTWDRDYVDFDITITYSGDNLRKVNEYFNKTDVVLKLIGTKASAETILGQGNGNSGKNLSMKINYIVKMPKNTNITINNSFGNTNIEDINGIAKIKQSFGNLTVGSLSKKSDISIEFGVLKIGKSDDLTLKMSFAKKSSLGSLNNLILTSEFSTMSITNVLNANIKSDYSTFNIENSGSMNFTRASFSKINLNNLENKFTSSENEFTAVNIYNVLPEAKLIDIKSSFSSINIGVDRKNKFSIDAINSYGKINTTSAVDFKLAEFLNEKYKQKKLGTIGEIVPNSGKMVLRGEHKTITIGK